MAIRQPLTLPKLKEKAQRIFNRYIRTRDEGQPCISCGSFNTAHASHFYSAGSYSGLRFNEDNVHASCISCNTYKGGNIHEYRKNIIKRIGQERLEKLDLQSSFNRYKKYSKFELELIIEKYK